MEENKPREYTEEEQKMMADTAIKMALGIYPSEPIEIKPKKKGGHYCRNPNCGWRIIEYPLFEGQEEGKNLVEGKDHKEKFRNLFRKETWTSKKWNWYNVLVGDWTKLLVIVCILIATFSYYHDSKAMANIYSDPCSFVFKNYDSCKLANATGQSYGLNTNGTFYFKNLSELNGQPS